MPEKEKKNVLKGSKKYVRIGVALLIVLVLLRLASGAYFRVNEQEQAVVTMFGKATNVHSAGLYFKIPVIQQVHMVDTTTHGMQIGYTTGNQSMMDYYASDDYKNQQYDVVEHEALMITSDFNFVDIDFYLEYRVSDPVKYLYTAKDPIGVLRNFAQASIRSTVIKYPVDDVITTGKSQIQAEVRERLMDALEEADIGIEVVNLSVQDAEPPTTAVLQAFKAVETAKQGADTAVNNAKKYQNEQIPAAEAAADKTLQQAEAAKEARIAEAEGQTARFAAMFEQYRLNPNVTRKRLFYETMEDILPGLKVVVDDGSTQTMLPLDSFGSMTVNGQAEQGGE